MFLAFFSKFCQEAFVGPLVSGQLSQERWALSCSAEINLSNSFTADPHIDFSPDLRLHAAVFSLSSKDPLLLLTWINFYAFGISGSWADRSPLHDAAFQGRLLSLKTLIAQVKAHR